MKNSLAGLLLASLVMNSIAQPQAPEGKAEYFVVIGGPGFATCGTFTKWKTSTSHDEQVGYWGALQWVYGYQTAFDAFSRKSGGQHYLDGIDAAAVEVWLGNYCASHPLESLNSAAFALAFEVRTRKAH